MAKLYTGDLKEARERFLGTSQYLRGLERPTIYAVKQQHIMAVEKISKATI